MEPSLYRDDFEHDACGLGAVFDPRKRASRKLVQKALEMLSHLSHRGGADLDSGDGAGILLRLPDAFFRFHAEAEGRTLPERYFVAQMMHTEPFAVTSEDLVWQRAVPTRSELLAGGAKDSEPQHTQCFFRMGSTAPALQEQKIRASLEDLGCIVSSCSEHTVVYKGLLKAEELGNYFLDFAHPLFSASFAIVHARFSTNTLPSWDLAHPFGCLAHNGEINTIKGNRLSLKGRSFGKDLVQAGDSDSRTLDRVARCLMQKGWKLNELSHLLMPPAWNKNPALGKGSRNAFQQLSTASEAWDGPAAVLMTDGESILASLDRNGLRPLRYLKTRQGWWVVCSEAGAFRVPPSDVKLRGKLGPGQRMLLSPRGVQGPNGLRRSLVAGALPEGFRKHLVEPDRSSFALNLAPQCLAKIQRSELYTSEEIERLLLPMALQGTEAISSMGFDVPFVALREGPQIFFNHFHQMFAQVTNPPLDAYYERSSVDSKLFLGAMTSLEKPWQFDPSPVVWMDNPLLRFNQWSKILRHPDLSCGTLVTSWRTLGCSVEGFGKHLQLLKAKAEEMVRDGAQILFLQDAEDINVWNEEELRLPSALTTSLISEHLLNTGLLGSVSLVPVCGDARQVHHFAVLMGLGAHGVFPYAAYASLQELHGSGRLEELKLEEAFQNFERACKDGLVKISSKMGISSLQSYRGARLFEMFGIGSELKELCFNQVLSRLGGPPLGAFLQSLSDKRNRASNTLSLPEGGMVHWRQDGESHALGPLVIAALKQACSQNDLGSYQTFCELLDPRNPDRKVHALRDLLDFLTDKTLEIPLDEVEEISSLLRRFKTGAMSYGSLSQEAHETIAIAMNRLGAKSNSGEGGEDPSRYQNLGSADCKNSAIKQVASARFGVTLEYLQSASEIQIKMAQGAKPGEGGQLPGSKVYPWIAKVRHATPGQALISPPPHHDIYSIEDLAQLIFDLRCANSRARISVKLVSVAGVGTIAAGVAKAGADTIVISGHEGGTGAAPLSSIHHAGAPWELGLREAHETLLKNGLRQKVRLEVDGQLRTGRDVVLAAILGAEEFGFATAPLVALGCVMMRACHNNTCPVGIATQDPTLRQRFAGKPEHVENYFRFVANDVRRHLAQLGFRSLQQVVGRTDLLTQWKFFQGIDLKPLIQIALPLVSEGVKKLQSSVSTPAKNEPLRPLQAPTLRSGVSPQKISNQDRCIGLGLGQGQDFARFTGSAGQSFGAFLPARCVLRLQGEANDYVGKGLCGGTLALRPFQNLRRRASKNHVAGNVCLYGATSGEAFFSGRVGERFGVRNSGAVAVVEGVGEHGCEYMTGGVVVVLGGVGKNFGAGMTGGTAFLLGQPRKGFLNRDSVVSVPLSPNDENLLIYLLRKHTQWTQSHLSSYLLRNWDTSKEMFRKVLPGSELSQKTLKRVIPNEDTLRGGMPNEDSLRGGMPNEDTLRGGMPNEDTLRGGMPNEDILKH